MPFIAPLDLEASFSPRMIVAAPRLTRLCEFEDEQLEAEYKCDECRHESTLRTAKIAVATALLNTGAVVLNLVAGAEESAELIAWYGLAYGFVWLSYAGCVRVAASRRISLSMNVFVLLYVCSHILGLALLPRSDEYLGSNLLPMHQLFIASLAAAYAVLDVRQVAVIAGAGTLGVALNTGLELVRKVPSCSNIEHFEVIKHLTNLVGLAVLEVVMVVGSIRINTTMRTAYHFQRVIKDDASLREVAVAERERMLQHEAEVELKLRTAEAAKAARGSLIRMVMHDLRSPLLSVANAVAIVQEVEPETRVDNPEVVESLRAMATCSQLMQNIVSDMLDFERIDSGRLVLVPAAMRVSQLLQAATDTFRGLAAAKGVTLRLVPLLFDLERAVFIGDVRRLQQCVNNGVSNSIKFTEAGGTVTIRARRGDDVQAQAKSKPDQPAAAATTTGWDTAAAAAAEAAAAAVPHASVVLEVDDSGVGLTADELHVLNQGEAFTQVGRGQLQGSGGSGLGLTIARDLLRLHGGSRMWLVSNGPGHGSTFRLELVLPAAPEGTPVPLEDSPMLEDSRTAVAGTRAEGTPGGSADRVQGAVQSNRQARPRLRFPPGFRVLHVEDDAVLRKTFELRVLKKLGIPFDVAMNGAEAVHLILEEKREYALVLMDNQMPILTGEKSTRALRAGGFGGLIVGMTGDPKGCSERDEFEAAGLSFCIEKDTPSIQRIAQMLGSFALDDRIEEESGAGSSSSPPALPVGQDSMAIDHMSQSP